MTDCEEERRLQRQREYNAAYRNANRDRVREIAAKWRESNRELARQRVTEYLTSNPGKQAAYSASYRGKNPEKRRETCAAYRKTHIEQEKAARVAWSAKNKDKLAAKAAARRAAKAQATPAWADLEAIAEIYAEARRVSESTGTAHHVDHQVPLKSKLVCGLHCQANLKIIPGRENLSKCNRQWPDMP